MWVTRLKDKYKNNKSYMDPILFPTFRSIYEDFLDKNKEYFLSKKDIFNKMLTKVENYIILNNKLPSKYVINTDDDRNEYILTSWISSQKNNYKYNKKSMDPSINENIPIRKIFEDFMEKYPKYFLTYDCQFYLMLNKSSEFLKKEGKRPIKNPKNVNQDITEKKIAGWINTAITSFNTGKASFNTKNKKEEELIKVNLRIEAFKKFLKEFEDIFNKNKK
jgi:hypothetical protein